MSNHKVKNSIIYQCCEILNIENFYRHVRTICEQLKIPTPVVLNSYAENFIEYNILKFKQRDFLEPVYFDTLVIENGDE